MLISTNTRFAVLANSLACACFSPNEPVATVADSGSTTESTTSGLSATIGDATTDTTDTTDADTASDATGQPTGSTDASTDDGSPICGDGEVQRGEVCDDGTNDGSYGSCAPDCGSLGPHCGDRIVQSQEDCDTGDSVNGDGCNVDCTVSGSLVWSRTFDTAVATGIDVDDEDAVVVATFFGEFRRYDADGSPDWTSEYVLPGSTETFGRAVVFEPNGSWLVGGSASTNAERDNAWWARLDETGDLLMESSYDSINHDDDALAGLGLTPRGDYYVGGTSGTSVALDSYIWLRKYDANDALLWAQTFDDAQDDVANAVAVAGDGSVVIGGSTEVDGEDANWWMRKYDVDGGVEWTRSAGGPGYDAIEGLDVGTDGSIAAAGTVGDEIWVRLSTPGGVEVWARSYDGPAADPGPISEVGYAVAVDAAGAVVVAGIHAAEIADGEAWLRKYSPDGDVLWTNTPLSDADSAIQSARAVVTDSNDYVVVVGSSNVFGTPQGWVQKYTP